MKLYAYKRVNTYIDPLVKYFIKRNKDVMMSLKNFIPSDIETIHEMNKFIKSSNPIALEGVGVQNIGPDSALFKNLSTMVSSTSNFIKSTFNGLTNLFGFTEEVKRDFTYYAFFSKNDKYPDIRNLEIQVPEGFTGNLKDYVKDINAIYKDFAQDFVGTTIEPATNIIAKIINDPVQYDSLRSEIKLDFKDISKYQRKLSRYFKTKHNTTAVIGQVYHNMSEIAESGKYYLELENLVKNVNLKDIKERTERLSEVLEMFIREYSDKSQNATLNKRSFAALTELVYGLAQQIEFYAAFDSLVRNVLYIGLRNTWVFENKEDIKGYDED